MADVAAGAAHGDEQAQPSARRGVARTHLPTNRAPGDPDAPVGLDLSHRGRRGDDAGDAAVRHQGGHRQAPALRQQVGDRRRRRPARGGEPRGHRAAPVRCRRNCTAASRSTLGPGVCRHAGAVQFQRAGAALLFAPGARARRAAGQSGAARRAQPLEPCDRPRAARPAESPPAAGRHRDQGRRGPAGTARARHAACRDLRPGFGDPAGGSRRSARRSSRRCPSSSMSTIRSAQPRPRLRLSIDQDRLEFLGVEQKDVYDTVQMLFGGIPVGYSHRGEGRNPIEISVRLPKSDLAWSETLAATPVPANTLPGSKTVVELGEVVRATREAGSPTDLPPRRPVYRHGHGRARGRLRGADLRHARGGRIVSTRTTGARCRSLPSACMASRSTNRSRRCCGTASGRSPM